MVPSHAAPPIPTTYMVRFLSNDEIFMRGDLSDRFFFNLMLVSI